MRILFLSIRSFFFDFFLFRSITHLVSCSSFSLNLNKKAFIAYFFIHLFNEFSFYSFFPRFSFFWIYFALYLCHSVLMVGLGLRLRLEVQGRWLHNDGWVVHATAARMELKACINIWMKIGWIHSYFGFHITQRPERVHSIWSLWYGLKSSLSEIHSYPIHIPHTHTFLTRCMYVVIMRNGRWKIDFEHLCDVDGI